MRKHKRWIIGAIAFFFIFGVILSAADLKPIAKFELEKLEYQQKEPIGVIDLSYTQDGKRIIQREWMVIINKKRKTGTTLSKLLKEAPPGQYEVFLRVKAQGGLWSDWTTKKLTIKKSASINVTTFKVEKSTYAIGEKLNFIYPYDNPNELAIRSQKWTYKNLATGTKVSGKPRYFSKAGKYEVSLQIQDEWGNWSSIKTCTVNVGTEIIERNGYYLFLKGRQGDLLEGYIDKDYNTFETESNVTFEDKAGTLLVSNSPEKVSTSGLLYQDTVSGKGRLLVHHENAASASKKMVILATSAENANVNLSITNSALKGPRRDTLGAGQAALRDYFKGTPSKQYTVAPGKTVCLYDSSLTKTWNKEELITGLFDFESNGKVTFKVAVIDTTSPLESVSSLAVLKKDVHVRGTFGVTERHYTVDVTGIDEPTKLLIGKESSEWVTGIDALTGETVQNAGNYGVSAFIKIKNNEDMGIILNARGGGYQGAIKWGDGKVFDSPREEILKCKKIATLIGMIKANQPNEFEYMLPNGSASPILFGFVPQRFWK